jgi:hypothetical protein
MMNSCFCGYTGEYDLSDISCVPRYWEEMLQDSVDIVDLLQYLVDVSVLYKNFQQLVSNC